MAAVCINNTLIVSHHDRMLYQHLDPSERKWYHSPVIPKHIKITNVFRCGNECYVIGKDLNDRKSKLYWWHILKLQLLTELPREHQLDALSAIGDERNVYIVGGEAEKGSCSRRVSCYNVDSALWKTMPDMPTGRKRCSPAILDNYLYVGGGVTIEGPSKLFQRLPLSTGTSKWDTLPSTTAKDCKLAAFCGKIVATGGRPSKSTVFEVYDETYKAWLELPSLNVERSGHSVCPSGNELIAVGGYGSKNSVEVFAL